MVDGFSCILDFPTFSGGGPPDPHLKEIHQLHPQNPSSTTTAAKGNKKQNKKKKKKKRKRKKKKKKNRVGKPSPIKTIYKKFIFRLYRNWKKEEGAGVRSFLCDLYLGCLKLICDIAEDKVCVAALSVHELCSSFYFVRDDGLNKFKFPVLCDYAKWRI